MSSQLQTLAEEAKNLTFNDPADLSDDPLTLRRKNPKDPNSPWLIKVCVSDSTPIGEWKDPFAFRVGEFCKVVSDGVPHEQRKELATHINALLGSNIDVDKLGSAKDFFVNAIPDSPDGKDKFDVFLGKLETRMGNNYPLVLHKSQWKKAKDFQPLTEDMLRQINWTLEEIKNHPRLKGHIEFEFVDKKEAADINYLRARPTDPKEPKNNFGGITGGCIKDGIRHAEILLNPDSDAWSHSELYFQPNNWFNPRNPYGVAAKEVKHETAHALGLSHWGYTGVVDPYTAAENAKVTTDKTVLAYNYKDSRNLQYDFRPVDFEALASLYVMLNKDIGSAKFLDKDKRFSAFNEAENVAVNASDAAGYSVSNFGGGGIIVKMTNKQYEKCDVDQHFTEKGTEFYTLTFDGNKTINLQTNAKIAMVGEDGGLTYIWYIKDILLAAQKNGITLDALDKDKELPASPPVASFKELKDIVVTAHQAAGHSVFNTGEGGVVVKITEAQYNSRNITLDKDGHNYTLSFKDEGGEKQIKLQPKAKLAVVGKDEKVHKLISIQDAQREAKLAAALKNGAKGESVTNAALPFAHLASALQRS